MTHKKSPEQIAEDIIKLVDNVGVGDADLDLYKCNIKTATAQAIQEREAKLVSALKDVLAIEGLTWMNQRETNVIVERARQILKESGLDK